MMQMTEIFCDYGNETNEHPHSAVTIDCQVYTPESQNN